jgi:hypothetical protein
MTVVFSVSSSSCVLNLCCCKLLFQIRTRGVKKSVKASLWTEQCSCVSKSFDVDLKCKRYL